MYRFRHHAAERNLRQGIVWVTSTYVRVRTGKPNLTYQLDRGSPTTPAGFEPWPRAAAPVGRRLEAGAATAALGSVRRRAGLLPLREQPEGFFPVFHAWRLAISMQAFRRSSPPSGKFAGRRYVLPAASTTTVGNMCPTSTMVGNMRATNRSSAPDDSATSYDRAAAINSATVVTACAAIFIVRVTIAAAIVTTPYNCSPSNDCSTSINGTPTMNCGASVN
jgi:hypothetical protein